MAIQSYIDEFKQNYEKPQVDGLIVGFSGIDPQRKSSGSSGSGSSCNCDNSNLSQEQKDIVRQLIREALNVIDFSECNCDPTQLSDEQKDIITRLIEQKIEELKVCECDNSTLTDEQRAVVKTIIDDRLQEFIINFDGGNIGDDDEPQPQPVYEPVDESNLNHEKLQNLLGGDANGHFHLTQDELLKVASYPPFSQIKHELLPDLMGGKEGEHFHLDSNQFRKLDILINTFFPDGSDKVIIVPNAPYSPDNPDNPLDDYDPYGGLPSGTPPAWELRMLPNGYSANTNGGKMYYGDLLRGTTYTNGLFVKLANNKTVYTQNLNNWANVSFSEASITASDKPFYQYLHIPSGILDSAHTNELLFIDNKTQSIYYTFSKNNSNGSQSFGINSIRPAANTHITAACYSEALQCVLFVATSDSRPIAAKKTKGYTTIVKNDISSSNGEKLINPGCAAWHPTTAVFCLTGERGTFTSFDGETWTFNYKAPHDLRELSYRQDLDNFFAWSGLDKTFYASADGINWTQLADTPIPLENISTVHYAPSLQWYCAVGVNAPYAYFSKDLKHWIGTKLRNNSNVDVADVIFMPSTGLFVAIPTSGSYYYTFNPSNWTD